MHESKSNPLLLTARAVLWTLLAPRACCAISIRGTLNLVYAVDRGTLRRNIRVLAVHLHTGDRSVYP